MFLYSRQIFKKTPPKKAYFLLYYFVVVFKLYIWQNVNGSANLLSPTFALLLSATITQGVKGGKGEGYTLWTVALGTELPQCFNSFNIRSSPWTQSNT